MSTGFISNNIEIRDLFFFLHRLRKVGSDFIARMVDGLHAFRSRIYRCTFVANYRNLIHVKLFAEISPVWARVKSRLVPGWVNILTLYEEHFPIR